MEHQRYILWLDELRKEDGEVAGRKCANLGEMIHLGFRVPPGFALSIALYSKFLEDTGVAQRLSLAMNRLGDLKETMAGIEKLSRQLQGLVADEPVPETIERLIGERYEALCQKVGNADIPVAVRSSGVQSRPGMFETILNVKGRGPVVDAARRVWASAFTPRAIAFRIHKGLPLDGDRLGVAILKMVQAGVAGIGFTMDPYTGDTSKIVIEAGWGFGEGVVSGSETSDYCSLRKEDLAIEKKEIGKKTKRMVAGEKGTVFVDVPLEMQEIPCLSDDEIKDVGALGKRLEDAMGEPQDFEWAIEESGSYPEGLYLLQTRTAKVGGKPRVSATDRILDMIAKRIYRTADK
ncbi:MAG: Phosphoenolpyruvate synthase [Syntrophorhabdus sp. PtaU1.Bin153]|nr:MAG: Phosphoenolpyruvate synthase [Syntrophorhabdus sp. PtaU1.Bin153]